MKPDDLHERVLLALRQRKAAALRLARGHRQRAAEAAGAGDAQRARTLALLAAHLEQVGALAEAEIRDRIARHARYQRAQAARVAAKKPRPRRADPLRAAVLEALAPLKRSGEDFKAVMRTWERGRIGSLRLAMIDADTFEVCDEDSFPPLAKRYSWRSLRTLFSRADKSRRR